MMASPVLALLDALIRCPSVTPDDHRCQALLIDRLERMGFVCETLRCGTVTNLWARRGQAAPLFVFAGHTDVVPPGSLDAWHYPPFEPTQVEGKLYGRGAADMKASIAAFVVAAEEFVAAHADHAGSIALLITSDEEGPAVEGTVKVCELLQQRHEKLDFCIVGEPTSDARFGDTIKNGRRGSLSGRLSIRGKQGHVAYPEKVRNPIHLCAPALAELVGTTWDPGNLYFPPTSFQISNFNSGTGATNVVPGQAVVDFNFRFSTESTAENLQSRVHEIPDRHQLDYHLAWTLSGQPFLTPQGRLCEALSTAIHAETGVTPQLSTTGGTSDGRFIARICPEVVEFGPLNATIHQVNEHIDVDDLEPLKNIYRRTLEQLLRP